MARQSHEGSAKTEDVRLLSVGEAGAIVFWSSRSQRK